MTGGRYTPPRRTGVMGESAASAALRERLHFERAASRSLCARADAVRLHAAELRRRTDEQRRSWKRWHRVWGRIAGVRTSWLPQEPRPGRPLVRVCMYCARVYVALPLAHGEAEADSTWHHVPAWVRAQIRVGALRVVPSHGVCPPCARQHGMD